MLKTMLVHIPVFIFQDLITVFMHLSYGHAFRMGCNNLLGKGDIYRGSESEREGDKSRRGFTTFHYWEVVILCVMELCPVIS